MLQRLALALTTLLIGLALSSMPAGPVAAMESMPAASMDCPDGMQMTIASLAACVRHAAEKGFITRGSVTNRLLSRLDSAEKMVNNGHRELAIRDLQRFIRLVSSQSGKAIEAEHADHMLMHARGVITALGG